MHLELLEPIAWPLITIVAAVVLVTVGALVRYHIEQSVSGRPRRHLPSSSRRATVPRKLTFETPSSMWRHR